MRETKLCFAPLGSLIDLFEPLAGDNRIDPRLGPFIVGGDPSWSKSNGWYGGQAFADSKLLLIDRFGALHTPSTYSPLVCVIAEHWRQHKIPAAQGREALNQAQRAPRVEQPTKVVGKKLNNLF